MTHIRDPRTKTSWSRTEKISEILDQLGPGPRKIQNLGPNRTRTDKNFKPQDRTRTNKILKILDRFGPVGPRTRRSLDP